MSTTNPHLATPPVHYGAPQTQADVVVYAVHGRGQSPTFMESLAQHVDLDGACWIMPSAHENSWYPEGFLQPMETNQPRLDQALDAVSQHLASLRADIGPRTPLVLLGFSQGACLLSEYILREQPNCAGAVLHTGGYIGPEEHGWSKRGDGLSGLPILMGTAVEDAWVPLHRVEATARALSELGARIELNEYDDPEHHINDDSMVRLRKFLTYHAQMESP
jgi:phospholipase/carboxylesterase